MTVAGQRSKECGFLVDWATQRTIADQQKSEKIKEMESHDGAGSRAVYMGPYTLKRELKQEGSGGGGRLSHTQSLAGVPAAASSWIPIPGRALDDCEKGQFHGAGRLAGDDF